MALIIMGAGCILALLGKLFYSDFFRYADGIDAMGAGELMSELETVDNSKRKHQLQLRLAQIYKESGGEAEKRKSLEILKKLSIEGVGDAAAGLCYPEYRDELKDNYPLYCEIAAVNKDVHAKEQLCIYYVASARYQDAYPMCEEALRTGSISVYLPMGIAHINGLGHGPNYKMAFKYLDKAFKSGPWSDRDPALEQILNLPDPDIYAKNSHLISRLAGEENLTAKPIDRVWPVIPHQIDESGQCIIHYSVTPNGFAFNIAVECSDPLMVEPMHEAFHQWKFSPLTIDSHDPNEEYRLYSYGQTTTIDYAASL